MRALSVGMVMLALVLGAVAPSSAQAQKRSRELLTREEILKSGGGGDLYKVLKALRPNFLEGPRGVRSMGGGSMSPLAVYVDKVRQSGADALFSIEANTVEEARYLDPTRSQNEYGISANGGAIVIKLYRADKDTTAKKPPR